MALRSCYECGNQVSTKAIACPQCGAPQKNGFLSKRILYALLIIYSISFWSFFHPFWTERWVGLTGGTGLATSNLICGLIYAGGFVLWNKLSLLTRRR